MFVPLTAIALTSHAVSTGSARATAAVAPHASPNGSGFVPNSALVWPTRASASEVAKHAAAKGVSMPSLLERCVLSNTLRDVKAGEEIMEDYATYECPWPGCSNPIVEIVRKAALSTD
jgi:hypothetical protein